MRSAHIWKLFETNCEHEGLSNIINFFNKDISQILILSLLWNVLLIDSNDAMSMISNPMF